MPFRLLTLNTWFAPTDRPARLTALLHHLEAANADAIALQEVTPDLLHLLLQAPWLRRRYSLPDNPWLPLQTHGYGVFLAIRRAATRFSWQPFDSVMGRGLLSARLPDGTHVGTVHLESMDGYGDTRRAQLAACTAALVEAPAALLAGDFNFDDTDPDAPSLAPWTDLWTIGQPHAPGFTVDSIANPYRALRGHTQKRIDRVLLHAPRGGWRLRSIQYFAAEPLPTGHHISDHFGLLAELDALPRLNAGA